MRALVYTPEFVLVTEDVDDPVIGPGEVLMEVEGAGICGSDVHGVATRSPRRAPPLIMGHEFVGRVVECGAETAGSLVGRRFAVNPQIPCGRCLSCRSGGENVCQNRDLLGGTRPGGFANLVGVPLGCLHALSGEVPRDVAVLVEPLATCVHAFRLVPVATPPTSVVVLGGGPIGLLAAKLARHLGAHRIVVSEANEERRGWASSVADAVATPDDLDDVLEAVTGMRGVELVVDAVGLDVTRCESVRLLGPRGTAVWLGMHDAEATVPAFEMVTGEQRVQGSFAYTSADFARAVALLERDPESFRLPTRRVPLDDGGRIFDGLLQGTSDGFLKAILAP